MKFENREVYWFYEGAVHRNIEYANRGYSGRCRLFIASDYIGPFNTNFTTLLRYDADTTSYLSNYFTGQIPNNSILYFTENSKFPRTKLSVSNFKRCIKVNKANYLVLKDLPKITTEKDGDIWHMFETDDSTFVYCIHDNLYDVLFSRNLDSLNRQLESTDEIKLISEIYCGKIKATNNWEFIENYNNGTYKVPFILDSNLDSQINSILPDPTLDELLAIKDMLHSSDSSIMKLATKMIGGFNISKFPLTFRLLLYESYNWTYSYNGGNSTVAKQIVETLGIDMYYVRRNTYMALKNVGKSLKTPYTKEDIDLAKELAKNIQEVQADPYRYEEEIWFPDELNS